MTRSKMQLLRQKWLSFIQKSKPFISKYVSWEFQRLFLRLGVNSLTLLRELGRDLKDSFKELFYYFPRNVLVFTKKVISYAPVLWRDRDWDHAYILLILEKKIKEVEKNFRTNSDFRKDQQKYKELVKALELLNLIIEDKVSEPLKDAHDAKWGSLIMYDLPYSDSSTEIRFDRKHTRTEKEKQKERKEHDLLLKKISKLEKKTWDELWSLLRDNLKHWWD